MTDPVRVEVPADLDAAAVLACAAGARVELGEALLTRVAERRRAVLDALDDGGPVYGVTTGMGALSDVRLTAQEQADHSRRLLLARAVGGPPWLDRAEARAVVAVRLRTFLEGDAGVSPGLCRWLATMLERDLVPPVPRTGSGAAGEILPLAHAWGHLAGGTDAPDDAPALGPKEGIALLAGVPVATALSVLRADDVAALARRWEVVAAAATMTVGACRDPWDAAVARGDEHHAAVLDRLRSHAGPPAAPPRHLQAPTSFRVVGPVLAELSRATVHLRAVAERSLGAVTDSPAFVRGSGTGRDAARFVGTAGFHGLDLAVALDTCRAVVTHVAATGAARLHRMLDPRVTGLPAQLSADPGPQAGLAPLHKRAVAAVHEVAGQPASTGHPAETSLGQEDVQTFGLEAAERLRVTLAAAEVVLACELLAVHQARLLDPDRWAAAPTALVDRFDAVAAALPPGTDDRPRGPDVEALRGLLRSGW